MPTPQEALNGLLRESSAAGDELSIAFAEVLKAEGEAGNATSMARQKYLEALRRFGAINSKISALTARLQKSKL